MPAQPVFERISTSIFLHFADLPYYDLWLLHRAVPCGQIRAIFAIRQALPGPPLIVLEELLLATCLDPIYDYKSSRNICEISIIWIDGHRSMRLDTTLYYVGGTAGATL